MLAEIYKLRHLLLASACAWVTLTCTMNFEPQAAGSPDATNSTAAPPFVPSPSPQSGFPKSSTVMPQPTVAPATTTVVPTVTPLASTVERTRTAQPQATPENPAFPGPSPIPNEAIPSAPPPVVGSKVGNRIPDFTLQLGHGTTITSDILLSENQPTFLYFFAAW